MRYQLCATLLVGGLLVFESISLAHCEHAARRKRYLAFPNKAAFVLTASLLKAIANDYKVGPTTRVVTFHELDVLFPLPHDPPPFELAQTALGQPPVFHPSHSRHRRELYSQLEELFYVQGLEGRACIMKAMCEAKSLPETGEENVLQELMTTIFSLPQNVTGEVEEEYKVDQKNCQHFKELCPISIFDVAFEWARQFSKLYNA